MVYLMTFIPFLRITSVKRIDNTSDKAEAENEREEFIHQYESYLTELELNGIEFDDYSYNDWLEEKIAREVKN